MEYLVLAGVLVVWGLWAFGRKYYSDPNFRDMVDREDAHQRRIDADRRHRRDANRDKRRAEDAYWESVRNWDENRDKRAPMKFKMPNSIFDRKWKWDVEIIQNDSDELNVLTFHNHGDAPHEVTVHVDLQVDGTTVSAGGERILVIPPSSRFTWDIKSTPAYLGLPHELRPAITAENVRILRFEPRFIHPDDMPTLKKPIYLRAFLEAVEGRRATNPVAEETRTPDDKISVHPSRNEAPKYLSAWGMHCLGIVIAVSLFWSFSYAAGNAALAEGSATFTDAVFASLFVGVYLYAIAFVPSLVARIFGLKAAILVHRITLLLVFSFSVLVFLFPPE